MRHRVTYQYTTSSNTTTGTVAMTTVLPIGLEQILADAERARRKGQLIRCIDAVKGTAVAFPADRLIDIVIEQYEPGTAK
ncbi:hypothetical protein OOK06_36725 [Streptomyces sp. NBC_00340]|uniref:hypothetical protein n=1 Tax=Streptomyces sp. NBC_00340 TaxID=2975716 RepID=UPI002257744F|nr:hypothetical protein [Streptomyces sp. NBC_00340]MCX5137616.1 hypothetical protein [Streptomyces sp. NBC_00340]